MVRASHAIEVDIADVERRLLSIKDELAQWSDAAENLALSAADARARNAAMGRGLGGALLGAKYRAAARRSAASSNAAVARDVADKRRAIAAGKQALREEERDLRWRLRDLKADLRDAKAVERSQGRAFPPKARAPAAVTTGGASLAASTLKDQLRRLKAQHETGALDAMAYEQARIALLQPHLRA